MEYVRLGRTGLKVSRICLGTMTYGSSKWRDWVLDEEKARPFYKRALEKGINFFDTADMYSLGASEEVTGQGPAGLREAGRGRRGHQGLQPHGPGSQRRGTLAQAHPGRHRRLAETAGNGSRRPVPDPSMGPRDANRGDAGSVERRGARRGRPATSVHQACTRGSS